MPYKRPPERRAKLTRRHRISPEDNRWFSQDGTISTWPVWESDHVRADYWLVMDDITHKTERALDSVHARELIFDILETRAATNNAAPADNRTPDER
ncbi:hypothetical protein [Nonomuraea sp. NPDC023979]|uniref:hypothetical protein n=1 Tax=Nonomuraea sp. NPDC023979 TaxID=3154796 RepID=UPI0033D62A2C